MLIDVFMQKANFNSVRSLADKSGIERTRMQNIRNGQTRISVEEEVRIAEACGLDPLEVIAAFETEREPDMAYFWSRYADVESAYDGFDKDPLRQTKSC